MLHLQRQTLSQARLSNWSTKTIQNGNEQWPLLQKLTDVMKILWIISKLLTEVSEHFVLEIEPKAKLVPS